MLAGENPVVYGSLFKESQAPQPVKVGAAQWKVRHGSKASEQGSSILPFATRVFIIFVIISEIQFSSWLSVRTDICDKASEEVMNLNYS